MHWQVEESCVPPFIHIVTQSLMFGVRKQMCYVGGVEALVLQVFYVYRQSSSRCTLGLSD